MAHFILTGFALLVVAAIGGCSAPPRTFGDALVTDAPVAGSVGVASGGSQQLSTGGTGGSAGTAGEPSTAGGGGGSGGSPVASGGLGGSGGAAPAGAGGEPVTGGSGGSVAPIGDCGDGITNGEETARDCGGRDCAPCRDTLVCERGSDCESGSCVDSGNGFWWCVAGTCSDGVQNFGPGIGVETGVDCGGGTCGPCPDGEGCFYDADCLSGYCVGEVMHPYVRAGFCAQR